ncbi:hypothetical protein EDD85DRAFT_939086 [Armillaria nabsnona]|nr:hypothetical protein EDD85DRAFT_939086 [Armillaria nabsnona]
MCGFDPALEGADICKYFDLPCMEIFENPFDEFTRDNTFIYHIKRKQAIYHFDCYFTPFKSDACTSPRNNLFTIARHEASPRSSLSPLPIQDSDDVRRMIYQSSGIRVEFNDELRHFPYPILSLDAVTPARHRKWADSASGM